METGLAYPIRHAALPQTLTPEELQQYIRKTAVEQFKDYQKQFFSKEELQELEHESCANGISINKMMSMLADFTELIKKGCDEATVFEMPVHVGTKKYDLFRRQNDDAVSLGYKEIEVEIFGLVNHENETMEFFTLDGNLIKERTRNLSIAEQHKYLVKSGFRASDKTDENAGAGLYIQSEIR